MQPAAPLISNASQSSTNSLPADNKSKQEVGWLRWGVPPIVDPICYLAKLAWQCITAVVKFVIYIVTAPFCYIASALSNKPDDQQSTVQQSELQKTSQLPSSRDLKNPGVVTPLRVDFRNVDNRETWNESKRQARVFLDQILIWDQQHHGAKSFGITFSANHQEQTVPFLKIYESGRWKTGVYGDNQANVMRALEHLQESDPKYQKLQGKIFIVPITTCQKSGGAGVPTDAQFKVSMDNVKALLRKGVQIIGWQNQKANSNVSPGWPFAIGDGVSKIMPVKHQMQIQNLLKHNIRAS